jgi:acetylornithine deacetylase/succinyl-diaminopimelate desuccinylase-like protein
MAELDGVLKRVDENLDAAVARLFDLVRIPSISTDPAYAKECARAAEFLVADLAGMGFGARSVATPGHPMVVAHHCKAPGKPHVLFYGHYDVQPVDPLHLWSRPPFDPAVVETKGGKQLVGRGTSDDKGQLMTFVEACRMWIAESGALPLNVTILFEGEEESGSDSLIPFLKKHKKELKADYALVCDTGMWDAKTPAITTALRGILSEEVTIRAANRDLHSGKYGSAARNPIHVLADIVAGLHDGRGRVTLPGFYRGVPETPKAVLAQWRKLEKTKKNFLADIGLSVPAGEKGRTAREMIWARPTAEVNGITGGYTGEGFKTVIAGEAKAKISFRLVGTQDPDAIRTAFRAFVKKRLPKDCKATFLGHGGSPAIRIDYGLPALARAGRALKEEWGKEAALIAMGGSIPVVGYFQSLLGMQALMVGYGLDDDRIHSPNEKYALSSFRGGTRSWARILAALAV